MPTTPKILLELVVRHPANEGHRVRAVVRAARWQAYKRIVGRPKELRVFGDVRFRAYPDSTQPGRFIYFGGLPDYDEMLFMQRYLRPGDGFIDGGANEGVFSLLAAKLVGPSGAVHAFEAVPEYVERARENARMNAFEQLTVHPQAIGDSPGEVEFALRGAGSRIKTAEDAGETVRAEVVTLDAALPSRDWAMAKLDVEGAEHSVLKGAEQLVKEANPPVWMLEVADRFLRRFASSEKALRTWLSDHGYDAMLYDASTNELVPAPAPIWPLMNILAVNRDALAEITARLQPR